jgi:hypothetical protein
VTYLIKDNWKIISHYMFITCGRPDDDLVEHDLAFRVLLAVVLPELFELKVSWPYDLSEMRSELFEARGAVFDIILDTTHVLMGLTIISMTSDMAADVMRRKTLTNITKRVLVNLLISIAASIVVIVRRPRPPSCLPSSPPPPLPLPPPPLPPPPPRGGLGGGKSS